MLCNLYICIFFVISKLKRIIKLWISSKTLGALKTLKVGPNHQYRRLLVFFKII